MKSKRKSSRRATILLMVVTLLALLFVIVTGFLSLARVDRAMQGDVRRADLTDAIVADINEWAESLIADQLAGENGQVLGGGLNVSLEDIPGYRRSSFLAALEPVWDEGAGPSQTFGFSGTWEVFWRLHWPAVTSLDGSVDKPQPFALYELMRDYDFTQDFFQVSDVQANARNPFMDADADGVPDTHFLLCAPATEAANAAAGTAVQLPRFVSNNPGDPGYPFVPWWIPPVNSGDNGLRGEKWRRYDETARYEAAVRVVSHGGMVTLDAPTLRGWGGPYRPFNREFEVDLFDAVRNPNDRPSMRQGYQPGSPEEHALFDDLHANARAVESLLRRRLILPGAAEMKGGHEIRRVPPILAQLQGEYGNPPGFRRSLLPHFSFPIPYGKPPGSWQRINLAGEERWGWAASVARSATEYNLGGGFGEFGGGYDLRHLLTTVNHSDELARKQTPDDPRPTSSMPLDLGTTGSRGATYQGELKFYLGEISKAFREVNPANGAPSSGSGHYAYDVHKGNVIIEHIAGLYYDMLAGHSGSGSDDWGNVGDPDSTAREAVSRRQQAFMLAVNTVAFAMPRSEDPNHPGYIGVVSYADTVDTSGMFYDNPRGNGAGATNYRYVGYTPQPLFTEAIAYRVDEFDPNDPNAPDPNDPNYPGDPNSPNYDDPDSLNIAIAVELYNPNDPYYDGTSDAWGLVDVFGLYLWQYAISVNEFNPNTDPLGDSRQWKPLTAVSTFSRRLNGRSFTHFVVEGGPNGHFDSIVEPALFHPKIGLDIEQPSAGHPFALTLWKYDWREDPPGTGTYSIKWFPVDEIVIDDSSSPLPNADSWECAYRDTSASRYYGWADYNMNGLPDDYARWNIATAERREAPTVASPPLTSTIGNSSWLRADLAVPSGVQEWPDPPPLGLDRAFSPTVALITMNAGRFNDGSALWQQFNNLPMFSNPRDLRPRSFPTVGFLLFVPRFSHLDDLTAGGAGTRDPIVPITQVLEKQWDSRGYRKPFPGDPALSPVEYPSDFGHMAVFDNTQGGSGNTYFDEVTQDETGTARGLPWGLLVFDYFTTLDPLQDANRDGEPDVDPLRVPGRINVNTAPWYVLANLPMLGPTDGSTGAGVNPLVAELPIRRAPLSPTVTSLDPSPSFWRPAVGLLVGIGDDPFGVYPAVHRQLTTDSDYHGGSLSRRSMPWYADPSGRYRLGPWLAQAAAAYRDGIQYVEYTGSMAVTHGFEVYGDSQLRGGAGQYIANGAPATMITYRAMLNPLSLQPLYGRIRGARTADPDLTQPDRPVQFGFLSVGELANVKGFDSSTHVELRTAHALYPTIANTSLTSGDFVKAVSVLALLDSQYLTTRSNTFTIYASVMDRENPQASVRSQVTVDRSNLLPRLTYGTFNNGGGFDPTWPMRPVLLDLDTDLVPETPVRTSSKGARPLVIAQEQVGYFNARYDD